MKKIISVFMIGAVCLFVPFGLSFPQDASLEEASCNDCQYKIVDKTCIKVEFNFSDKKFSGTVKSGHRDTCQDGNGTCQSTSCK